MQSLRAEGPAGVEQGEALASALAFKGIRAALRSFYGAKIEATRRSILGREAVAAVRAVFAEQRDALRALTEWRQAAARAVKERREIERRAVQLSRRQAREAARPP